MKNFFRTNCKIYSKITKSGLQNPDDWRNPLLGDQLPLPSNRNM